MKKRLFVDMDGTLAVWNHIDTSEELYEKGYYRNLSPMQEVINVVKSIIEAGEVDVYILSAYLTDSKYALEEKKAWLEVYLPEIKTDNHIFVKYGENKSAYIKDGISKNDYLLDDYTKNLIEWNQQDGTSIKLLNGINHTNKTWQGEMYDGSSLSDAHSSFINLKKILDKPNITKDGRKTIQMREDEYKTLIGFTISYYEDIFAFNDKITYCPDVMDLIGYEPLYFDSFQSLYKTEFEDRMVQSLNDFTIDEIKTAISDELFEKLCISNERFLEGIQEIEQQEDGLEI